MKWWIWPLLVLAVPWLVYKLSLLFKPDKPENHP